MSYDADSVEHETETEGLLRKILKELIMIRMILAEASEIEIEKGDI